ncbi:hypothetical protein OpiT1DRAFT_05660 [Opitutaceae bacterium TAV1]|nr:hypothetical protein OpiT1DRAFT_05660 [Opitutaceae bacterium TAV1]
MSLLSAFKSTLACAFIEKQLTKLGEPYGVLGVRHLAIKPDFRFAVAVVLDGDADLRVWGRIRFDNDSRAFIETLNTDRAWLTLLANSLPFLRNPLPLTPEQTAQLRGLWP